MLHLTWSIVRTSEDHGLFWRTCPNCNGTGYDFDDGGQCECCDGTGRV